MQEQWRAVPINVFRSYCVHVSEEHFLPLWKSSLQINGSSHNYMPD